MSLILDALKRAERERQSSEVFTPIIESVKQDVNQPNNLPEKNHFNWRWILVLMVVGSFLALTFFNKESKSEIKPISKTELISKIEPKQETKIKKITITQSSISQTSQAVTSGSNNATQAVTDLYQQPVSSLPKVEDIQVAQLYADNAAVSSIAIDQAVEIPASVAVTNPLPDVNAQLPKNMQTDSEARRIMDTDAIAFDELSFNQKQLFPSISYSQHNYLGNSASSVVINGELLRVGSRITQDLSIEEIVEDGVIFNFYQKRVSFKALSGWINM